MEAFPVAPELMQAFPLGALSLLVTVASTVAAQHGVDCARRICRELARNDELWGFIAARVDQPRESVDDVAPDAESEIPTPLVSAEVPERADLDGAPAPEADEESTAEEHDLAPAPESHQSAEFVEVAKEQSARARRSKSKRRRKNKTNGSAR
jgi:hypothetical protein